MAQRKPTSNRRRRQEETEEKEAPEYITGEDLATLESAISRQAAPLRATPTPTPAPEVPQDVERSAAPQTPSFLRGIVRAQITGQDDDGVPIVTFYTGDGKSFFEKRGDETIYLWDPEQKETIGIDAALAPAFNFIPSTISSADGTPVFKLAGYAPGGIENVPSGREADVASILDYFKRSLPEYSPTFSEQFSDIYNTIGNLGLGLEPRDTARLTVASALSLPSWAQPLLFPEEREYLRRMREAELAEIENQQRYRQQQMEMEREQLELAKRKAAADMAAAIMQAQQRQWEAVAPYAVPPGTQYVPQFGPGGAVEQLFQKYGYSYEPIPVVKAPGISLAPGYQWAMRILEGK
jgi:hypothetical protein